MRMRPGGRAEYQGERSLNSFTFPQWSSNLLRENEPLRIDSQRDQHVFTLGNRDLGSISYLMQ